VRRYAVDAGDLLGVRSGSVDLDERREAVLGPEADGLPVGLPSLGTTGIDPADTTMRQRRTSPLSGSSTSDELSISGSSPTVVRPAATRETGPVGTPTDTERAELAARRAQLRERYLAPAGDRPASPGRGIHHAA
jgi:hypothetical protein